MIKRLLDRSWWVLPMLMVLIGLAFMDVRNAEGAMGCGLKPLPPLGCQSSDAVCICDEDGCRWVWICGRN